MDIFDLNENEFQEAFKDVIDSYAPNELLSELTECGYQKDETLIDKNKYYLNLTNGIEFLENDFFKNKEYNFVRIQSTSCEQHLWDKLIQELDYNFLLDIALGYNVIVCDTSAHKSISRAIYQGLKFIEYALNRIWLKQDIDIYVNNINCKKYFAKCLSELSNTSLKKIKYVRKFLNTDKINLSGKSFNTIHDGDYEYYKKTLIENTIDK